MIDHLTGHTAINANIFATLNHAPEPEHRGTKLKLKSPRAAKIVVKKIIDGYEKLAEFPELGASFPELHLGCRCGSLFCREELLRTRDF